VSITKPKFPKCFGSTVNISEAFTFKCTVTGKDKCYEETMYAET
jgi:hypothetical protein